jgi:dienelactone hydrolase
MWRVRTIHIQAFSHADNVSPRAPFFAGVALIIVILGVWQLEAQRSGLLITDATVGTTPVTYYARQEAAAAPLVVIAHGFAGSRPLMESYALALARAGYVVASFDFEGHGQNPTPMSGDVTSVDGTTRLLVDETLKVMDAASQHPLTDGRMVLLGHSMASDIIVRAAQQAPSVDAVIAISPFSQAITARHPHNLLMITGEWEPHLRSFALEAARMVDPAAVENETVVSDDDRVTRQAFVAPHAEHVGILFNRPGIEAAVSWLNETFDRSLSPPVPARLRWIALVLAGTLALAWPLSRLVPQRPHDAEPLGSTTMLMAVAVPTLVAPVLAVLVPAGFLPVLVADYLAVHMLLYGLLQLVLLRWVVRRLDWATLGVGLAVAAYGILVFGMALDRYFANFTPTASRLPIIAALAVGAIAYMLADSVMANRLSKLWQRIIMRLAFLASLGIGVALDFDRLFFLVLIIPVIALFYLIFGIGGRWVAKRAGPVASGIGLGLLLAWSLGVTFPMFV